jgi:hypothetical protein
MSATSSGIRVAALAALVLAGCPGGHAPPPPSATVLAEATVGAAGGTVAAPGGPSLTIPAGALDAPTAIRITAVGDVSAARYGFEPNGQVFARPVMVRMPVATGTTSASLWWERPGGGYEPVGGTLDQGTIVAEVAHFSGGYAGADTGSRTVSGSRVITLAASSRIYNVPVDLTAATVTAWVPRSEGGYDAYAGEGSADGLFRVPGVPDGPVLLQVGSRLVRTSQSVIDLGELMPGRPGLETVDLTQTLPLTLDLSNLAPWQAPSSTTLGLGDRLDVFSADANDWFWGAESALSTPLQAGAMGLSGSLDLLHAANKKVPVFALDAARGDRLVVAQQSAAVSSGGIAYQATSRVFEPAPSTLAPGAPASFAGAFVDVTRDHAVDVAWSFGTWSSALTADGNPSAGPFSGTFANRFRIVGQAGGLQYGTHELICKPDFLTAAVPDGTDVFATGEMRFGMPLSGDWGAHWIASADRGVPVQVGSRTGTFPVAIRSMGALGDPLVAGAPAIGLPRSPAVNGADLFTARAGVGLTPTLSWDVPAIGTADGYGVQIVDLLGSGDPPWKYVAFIDTPLTAIELPPGILQAGHTYLAVIRAYRRGIRVEAPLRIALPVDVAVQVTATFAP